MALFDDARVDSADLADLVNGSGLVTTRYGDNPKKSWKYMENEFDTMLSTLQSDGESQITVIVNDLKSSGEAQLTTVLAGIQSDGDAAIENFTVNGERAIDDFNTDGSSAISNFNSNGQSAINLFNTQAANDLAEFDQALDQYKESRGFNNKGTFADGFTYELPNDVGIDASGNPWIYNGTLPFTVAAGTAPTSPTYTQVTYGTAAQVSMNTSDTVQSFADSFALKIFQSPTDGGLTEIQTRTVEGGEVYEVRKTSDGSLATIYSDAAGTTEIAQNGTDNVSGSDGVVEFYIADGDYYVEVGGVKGGFSVGHNGLSGRNLAGAHDSIYYRNSTVQEVSSGVFTVGSLLSLADRSDCKFKVVSGGVPNGLDILDAGNGNTATLLLDSGEVVADHLGSVNADALNRSIDILDTGNQTITGGYINIPIGSFSVDETIDITNSESERLVGVTISGKGKQGSTLDFSSSASGDGLSFGGAFSAAEDLAIQSAKASALKLKIDNAKAWNHFNARRVRAGFSAGHGVHAEQGFMGHFEQVFATHAQAGSSGFKFDGLHTSLHFNNCYAASNTVNGCDFTRTFYSVVTASASDSNGQHGYRSQNSHTLLYNGSGSESNGRSGWYSVSSDTIGANEITINSCFAFNNNSANAGWANLAHVEAIDGVSNKVIVRGSKSQAPANPISDIIVDGLGAYLVDEDNSLPNGAISRNKGYIHHVNRTKVIHDLSVTAATNVVELANPQGHQTDFGGTITVVATNSDPSLASAKNSATYHLLVDKGVQASSVVEIAKAGLTSGGSSSQPSFTWGISGNFLTATPINSTSGTFTFQVLSGGVAVKVI